MYNSHNRIICIDKEKLIAKIKKNKETHIKEYNEAVDAYRLEAAKQLEDQKNKLAEGSLTIHIQLTTPINRSEEYDKIVEMFTWELAASVDLTQAEFNEYVHDDNDQSRAAKYSNSFYASKSL